MIVQPDWIDDNFLSAARETVLAKGTTVGIERVRFERFNEGLCVQTLHLGSYDDEAPVLAEMHANAIAGQGLRLTGKHHEIYLSDPRRTAPERLRTILRQPVTRV